MLKSLVHKNWRKAIMKNARGVQALTAILDKNLLTPQMKMKTL